MMVFLFFSLSSRAPVRSSVAAGCQISRGIGSSWRRDHHCLRVSGAVELVAGRLQLADRQEVSALDRCPRRRCWVRCGGTPKPGFRSAARMKSWLCQVQTASSEAAAQFWPPWCTPLSQTDSQTRTLTGTQQPLGTGLCRVAGAHGARGALWGTSFCGRFFDRPDFFRHLPSTLGTTQALCWFWWRLLLG